MPQILIYPTAIGWFDEDSEDEKDKQLDSWITVQRGHAIANGIPLIAINRVGKELDNQKNIDGIRFWGNSFVVGAQGEFITKASSDKDEVIIVNIDLVKNEDVRKVWPFLRDRRIDTYSELNRRFID